MDKTVTQRRYHHDNHGKQHHAAAVTYAGKMRQRLPGQHGATGGKAHVHHADQQQRDHRAINAKLGAAGNHLRQPKAWPLHRMQRHHCGPNYLSCQQPHQRPDDIAGQDYGKRAGDYRGNLQITAEPQGELAEHPAMALGVGNIINTAGFDKTAWLRLRAR